MTHPADDNSPAIAQRPLLTLALLAYNQEKYIREAIEGAFAQTYEPLEIILSDDFSSDRTYEIMQEMTAQYAGPHRIILDRNTENIGKVRFGKRVTDLLQKTTGQFVVLAAGDDVSLPNRCHTLFEYWDSLSRAKVSLHSCVQPIDENGNVIGPVTGNNEIAEIPLSEFVRRDGRGLIGASHGFSRALIERFGRLPDRVLIEDGAIAFRARLSDGIFFIPEALVRYRRHSENLTNGRELRTEADFDRYISALNGLHSSFLSDYTSHVSQPDSLVIAGFGSKFRAISRMQDLFRGTLIQRLQALAIYSERLPWKRRLWLTLRLLGLIGPNDVLPSKQKREVKPQ